MSSEAFVYTSTFGGGPGGAAWGDITGTLADQTDLQAELDNISSKAAIATLSSAAYTLLTDYSVSNHFHSASKITSSTFAVARMGTGSPDGTNFLRGDGVWAAPTAAAAWGSITGSVSTQTDITTYAAASTHVHSASDITSSTLALARIAGGTYNASTYLSGTSTFNQPSFSSLANMPTLGTAASTNASDYVLASKISTIRTTSLVFTTTTSSLPLTGFGFTVSNTVNYSFEFGLIYASAISSTGLRVGLQYPATSTFAANVEIPAVVATGTDSRTQGYIIASGSSVVAPSTPLASTQYVAFIYGQILPSANGTLQFCYATEVAASAITSFAGSYGILTTY